MAAARSFHPLTGRDRGAERDGRDGDGGEGGHGVAFPAAGEDGWADSRAMAKNRHLRPCRAARISPTPRARTPASDQFCDGAAAWTDLASTQARKPAAPR